MKDTKKLDSKGDINWNTSYSLDNSENLWGNDEVPIMAKIAEIFKKDGGLKYLDLPCGDGRNMIKLAQELQIVVGADSSENALKITKDRLDFFNIDNKLLLSCDVFNMPFFDNEFDGIFSRDLLGH